MSSNQTRHPLTTVGLIAVFLASPVILAGLAVIASRYTISAGVLVLVLVFGCGLTFKRRQRTPDLPRPAEAPLPVREPTQLAA